MNIRICVYSYACVRTLQVHSIALARARLGPPVALWVWQEARGAVDLGLRHGALGSGKVGLVHQRLVQNLPGEAPLGWGLDAVGLLPGAHDVPHNVEWAVRLDATGVAVRAGDAVPRVDDRRLE